MVIHVCARGQKRDKEQCTQLMYRNCIIVRTY